LITVVQLVATMRQGGAEAVLRTLVPRLAAEPDLNLHVVSVYDPNLDEREREALGAPLHAIGRRTRKDIGFAPRLVSTLRRLRPDIVHGHIHTGKFAGRMAAIAAGVPTLVFTEHGDETGGLVSRSLNRVLNARTARFIVFTEDERRRYALAEAIPLARIDVIPNGIVAPQTVDAAAVRRELGLSDEDFVIITVGRLSPEKNQQLVLRALAALRSRHKSVRLVVAGEGPDAQAMRALADDLDLGDAVRFLGYRSDAQRFVSASDLLVLPSEREKMPLVLGEAMLAGVTVLSTPWTGVDAFIEDGKTGILAADWSVEAFASAIARTIEDPGLRRDISTRALGSARERFDLGRMVRSHAELYRSLARNTKHQRLNEA
jgi:glycosyltransferase involved in cell wall biosynthesis